MVKKYFKIQKRYSIKLKRKLLNQNKTIMI